jgi:transcriptional regulator with XRE-family HTH domain
MEEQMKIMPKRNIVGHMAIDSPLRRWRRSQGLTQEDLAQRLGVKFSTVARWEQQFRTPRGQQLEKLAEVTGLSLEALLFPERYLREHPDFLATWGEQPPRRGRWKRSSPEEGTTNG